uniref:Uncharacterized protein n=1 Tax=Romanomermis culicivorax TaxID=13658 RepID=A0A915IUX0_ROMCU
MSGTGKTRRVAASAARTSQQWHCKTGCLASSGSNPWLVHVDGFLFGSEMLQMDFPILIGTIPLRTFQQQPLEPNAPELPAAEPQLPSYEQAILGAGACFNIADENDDEHTLLAGGNYGPQCPYYKI